MVSFHVGQRVECIDDRKCSATELSRGQIYTVARVNRNIAFSYAGVFCIGLELVETEPEGDCKDFAATRFRPVVERKTDISIFKAMLNPSKQGVSA